MISPEIQNKKNKEFQIILQKIIQASLCSPQNAATLWQNWLKASQQQDITPQQFLSSCGFSGIFKSANQETAFQPHTTTGSHKQISRAVKQETQVKTIGNYQIVNEIARGGMGIVYKVYQPEMKRFGALKVLLNSGATDVSLIRRFFREAKVTAALQHPNVIPIYDMGSANGQHYFVMKYVTGGSFEDFLKKQTEWEPSLAILVKVCNALAHAHNNKVLHRDIKPANIILDENGEPYLADFGLAKRLDSQSVLTQTGATIGTVYYMSPEQVSGKNVTHLSDIYAIGVILYLILTNQLPFVADFAPSLYRLILKEPPVPPRKLENNVPKALEYICMKCLDKNPENRYSSAALIAKDIQKYLQNKNVVIKEKDIRIRTRQTLSNKNTKVALSFLAMLLVVACLYLVFFSYSTKSKEQQALLLKKYEEAYALFMQGSERAKESLVEIIQQNEEMGEAHFLLAKIYISEENYNLASKHLQKALSILDNPNVYYLEGVLLCKQEKYDLAIQKLSDAIKKHSFSELYRLRANAYKKINNAFLAEKDTNKATELEDVFLESYKTKLAAYEKQQNWQGMLQVLEQIVEIIPNCEYAYVERSRILFLEKRYEEALTDISKALEIEITFPYILQKLKCLRMSGYLEQAINLANTTLNMRANTDEIMELQREQAKIYISMQQLTKAKEIYLSFNKNLYNDDDLLQLAKIEFSKQNYPIAESYINTIMGNSSQDVSWEVYYYYAQILYEQKKYTDALKYIQKIENDIQQDNSAVALLLAKIHLELKNFVNSAQYAKQAKIKDNGNAEIYFTLGKAQYALQDYNAAIEAYSECIKLEPWNDIFYQERGITYFYQRQFYQSNQDFLQVIGLNPQNYLPLEYLFQQSFETKSIKEHESNIYTITAIAEKLYDRRDVDILEHEKQKLSVFYLTESTRLKFDLDVDENRVDTFLDILCNQDAESLSSIAETGLLKMAHHAIVLEKIKQRREYKNVNVKKQRLLENLQQKITQKQFEISKIQVKALLVRYYVAHDEKALQSLYQFTGHIKILESILWHPQESSILRYMVAQVLYELKTLEGYELLQKGLEDNDNTIRLFCYIGLLPIKKYKDKAIYQPILEIEDSFTRVIGTDFIPVKYDDILKLLLEDKDLLVRLTAAKRLWQEYQKPEAAKIFIENFDNPDPLIRSYCHVYFWDFKKIQELDSHETVRKYEKYLLRGIEDENEKVKRICIQKVSEFTKSTRALEAIEKYAHSPQVLVAFQALGSIGLRGNVGICAEVASEKETRWILKLPLLLSIRLSKKNKSKSLLNFLGFINKIFDDEHANIRVFFLRELGKMEYGIGKTYLEQNLNDKNMHNRAGALFGLSQIQASEKELIEKVFPLLQNDPEEIVKASAAFAIVSILGSRGKWDELEKYHKIIKTMSFHIRDGAAWGYAGLTLKSNQRQRFIEETGTWNPEQVYGRFIERLESHFRDEDVGRQSNDERAFTLAIDQNPEDAYYLFELSVLYHVQKKYDMSIQYIEKAMQRKKEFGIFYLWLAKACHGSAKYQKALDMINKGLEITPWNRDMIYTKWLIQKDLNLFEEAEMTKTRLDLFFRE